MPAKSITEVFVFCLKKKNGENGSGGKKSVGKFGQSE